jgi:hypothetical protein
MRPLIVGKQHLDEQYRPERQGSGPARLYGFAI